MPMPRRPRNSCLVCSKPCSRAPGNLGSTYCSGRCHKEHKYTVYIQAWLRGEVSGARGTTSISQYIRRWLTEKYGECCSQCGWAERNSVTGRIPIEIDHINGDGADHRPENIRLLCPNCHALTATYRSLNTGRGRKARK